MTASDRFDKQVVNTPDGPTTWSIPPADLTLLASEIHIGGGLGQMFTNSATPDGPTDMLVYIDVDGRTLADGQPARAVVMIPFARLSEVIALLTTTHEQLGLLNTLEEGTT